MAEADAREVGIIAVLGELSWGQLAATVRSQVGWPRNGALCSCWRNAPEELGLRKHSPPFLPLTRLPLVPPMGARWQRRLGNRVCRVSVSAS